MNKRRGVAPHLKAAAILLFAMYGKSWEIGRDPRINKTFVWYPYSPPPHVVKLQVRTMKDVGVYAYLF